MQIPMRLINNPERYPALDEFTMSLTPSVIIEPIDDTDAARKGIGGAFLAHNVLSAAECDQLLGVAATNPPTASRVGSTRRSEFSLDVRSSNTTWLRSGYWASPIQRTLEGRLKKFVNATDRSFEKLQLTSYLEQGQYDWHSDTGSSYPWRTRTALIFLTQPPASGGETQLIRTPHAGPTRVVQVTPRRGSALVFDAADMHRGMPVVAGRPDASCISDVWCPAKVVANLWVMEQEQSAFGYYVAPLLEDSGFMYTGALATMFGAYEDVGRHISFIITCIVIIYLFKFQPEDTADVDEGAGKDHDKTKAVAATAQSKRGSTKKRK